MARKIKESTEERVWWEEGQADSKEDDYPIDEYDIIASPNDFNVSTLFNFIESGVVKIPGFQRNYVWDTKRASKLIESIIIGLPVPQIFLYEEARNRFLVIDGQQRLMSIYYFIKQRFPRKEKSGMLRQIFDEHGSIPDEILHNDDYFSKFNLQLPEKLPGQPNKFHGLNYSTLGELQTSFDLRTIRNVIVKQVSPRNDESSIYEIFNRLNSGGTNLTPQETRRCMYDSKFYEMIYLVNTMEQWRRLVGIPYPDLHMKDVEILLRGFAMLQDGDKYNPSMVKFLNVFSKRAKGFGKETVTYLRSLFESFLASCSDLQSDAFHSTAKRFSITIYESVFCAVCGDPYTKNQSVSGKIVAQSLSDLKKDKEFLRASQRHTTDKVNVELRLSRARELIRMN